ncbi:conidial yellow pigment biosynthesis polyketide synthase [Lasiodiplodia theobromae]|nr:conidial yellow pigment biosynthesis polyketide synthase [Lasiodiplodia theobromae]
MVYRDILLFAGQGSSSFGPDHVNTRTADILASSHTANSFLKACHEALITELDTLDDNDKRSLPDDMRSSFNTPESLIDPPSRLCSNPVVQGTTLFIHQMLEFIAYESALNSPPELVETSGFCSGVLAAIVTASSLSPRSPDFVDTAVHAYRLSFWIGLRNGLFCRRVIGGSRDGSSWSLTVLGMPAHELEGLVNEYNKARNQTPPIRIAAVLSEKAFSLTGPGTVLDDFRANSLPKSTPSLPANVHGYYHGGPLLHDTQRQVLDDVQRRGINFPAWEGLQVPVRSTCDGEYLNAAGHGVSLLEAALQSILVQPVDWWLASQKLVSFANVRLNEDINLSYRVLALGPNAKSLLRALKENKSRDRLHIADGISNVESAPSPNDIAIVGMSANFPRGKGTAELWDTLEKGLSALQEIPPSRFQISDYYEKDADRKQATRKLGSKHGNFLENPFEFDNGFFQISPREAKSMDPQQRLLLLAALDALEDAGYSPDATESFLRDSMGVYVGVATGDYTDNTRDDIDVYYSPGTLRAFLSGRISYSFQLKGPSVVIDTACSSSAVALYQACRALQAGDCDSALAGGVNVISSPDMYLGLSRAHFLSPTGQCKPWDASADGYCRAEGCGMFVLKRFSDAVAEGDRIHGVIRGIEVNQCGTAKSITHPDAETQARLFKQLFNKTKIDPSTINVVEAHGTGTQAGDFAEVSSLQAAFGSSRSPTNPLFLSSIKGNMGHCEAASGAAGLSKLLLMMQQKQIPPQASFKTLNPRLATIEQHNIVVPTTARPWHAPGHSPRRALLNNFGAAGSNAALIVEEYQAPPHRNVSPVRSCHVLNISAKTSDALERLREAYCEYISRSTANSSLTSLCWSANARRREYDMYRISVTGSSPDELLRKLQQAECPSRWSPPQHGSANVFVFSGQGAVYPGMGAELLSTAPLFAEQVLLCNSVLTDAGFPSVETLIGDDDGRFGKLDEKEQVVVAQCACFVLEYSLAKLWMSWGVQPDMLIGHSVGEFAALAISGALSLRDSLLLLARRAKLMTELCAPAVSGMVACNIPTAKMQALLAEQNARLCSITVACKNSTSDCVVAGPLDQLNDLVAFCKSAGIRSKQLAVPYGFHSAAMDPIMSKYTQAAAEVTVAVPKIPVASSCLGKLLQADDINAEYFANHTRNPVEFEAALGCVASAMDGRNTVFLEIGPAATTLPMAKSTLKAMDASFLPSMKPTEKPWASLSSTLSSLHLQRQPIRWREVYRGAGATFLDDIPRYPLSLSTFVVPYKEPISSSLTGKAEDSRPSESPFKFLNGNHTRDNAGVVTFEAKLSDLQDFIKAHSVGGSPLCPASVYIELALESLNSSRQGESQRAFHELTDITFERPLVYTDDADYSVLTTIGADGCKFQVKSDCSSPHCSGTAADVTDTAIEKEFTRRAAYIKRQRASAQFADRFSSRMIYEVVFPRVVSYSGPYLSLKEISITTSGLEGYGTFQLPQEGVPGFVCPPAFTDTLLHAAGFIANSKIRADEACICVQVERVTVPANNMAIYGQEMSVYCSLVECHDDIIGDAYALDDTGKVLAAVHGMHFKRLRLKAFQAHLARAIQKPLEAARPSHTPPVPVLATVSRPKSQPSASRAVHEKVAQVCGIEGSIDPTSSLEDLGIDSLMFIELVQTLQQEFAHLSISKADLEDCTTLLQIEQVIAGASGEVRGVPTPSESSEDETYASRSSSVFPDEANSNSAEALDAFCKEICGFSLHDVDPDADLASLGVDSLLSIELATGLASTFGIHLGDDSHAAMPALRVRQLQELVCGGEKPAAIGTSPQPSSSSSAALSSLRDSNDRPPTFPPGVSEFPAELQQQSGYSGLMNGPLYLFHDGSGLCNPYACLAPLDRRVRGIFALDFFGVDTAIQRLEDLAALYIERSGLMNHTEPIVLGGWSFGGVLAFEVSRQLRQSRSPRAVLGVVLIDSPAPVDHVPLPSAVISHIAGCGAAPNASKTRGCVEAQFRRNAELLGRYKPRPANADVPVVMLKCKRTFDTQRLCGVSYPWLSDEGARMESVKVWERLVGGQVRVLDVDGDHFDLFAPNNVESVSSALKEACRILEAGL